jgi:hypothetical protein
MTNQEAQFILDAYRPNGRDANEPMFAEALRQAQQDPTLNEWFAREQKHAATVASKLREIAPPPGLREAILAGARVSESPKRDWWTQPSWLAIAASVALMAAAGAWIWSVGAPLRRLEAVVVTDALHAQHGSHGAPSNALIAMLSQPSTRMGGTLPVDFATLKLSGCRTVSFAGRDLLEVCFARDGGEFHLYMARREDFPGLKAREIARIDERDGLGMATWSDAGYHYVLASKSGPEALKRLL